MEVVPKLTPVIVGCVAGVVAPPAMNTLAGAMVAVVRSLLLKFTVTPAPGAAGDKLIGNGADVFGPTDTFVGRLRVPAARTFTITLAGVTFGALPLAVMVVDPDATANTGTLIVLEFGPKETDCGTVAAAGFDEIRLTVKPLAGAGEDRFNGTFIEVPAFAIIGDGGKLSAFPTNTCLVAGT
jgi:hypothetical protein